MVNEPFLHHIQGDTHRRQARPFAVSGLQNEQMPVLDGKFEILHVGKAFLQNGTHFQQFPICIRHFPLQIRHRMRRPNTRHNVLTLRIDKIFAVKFVRTVGGIARERHTRRTRIAGIAKHHRLNVHRRSPIRRYVIFVTIQNGAFIEPGTENSPDGAFQLFEHVLRKFAPFFFFHQLLKADNDVLQILRVQFGIKLHAFVLFGFG